MYKLKHSHAYQHGVYIRPGEYTELWRDMKQQARMLNLSLSELVSHTMYLYWNGKPAGYSKMGKIGKEKVIGRRRNGRG